MISHIVIGSCPAIRNWCIDPGMHINRELLLNDTFRKIQETIIAKQPYTLRTMAAPVECPKQKHGNPGFSVKILSRNDFCTMLDKNRVHLDSSDAK
jgi:hypothetical protein